MIKQKIENIISLANSEDSDKEVEIIRTCEKILEELKKKKKVFVVFASDIDDDENDFDTYAVASSQEIANAIIKKDSEYGQIHGNAFTQSFCLYDDSKKV